LTGRTLSPPALNIFFYFFVIANIADFGTTYYILNVLRGSEQNQYLLHIASFLGVGILLSMAILKIAIILVALVLIKLAPGKIVLVYLIAGSIGFSILALVNMAQII
jgi:hypothetical protein